MGLGSKERPKNGVFGISPARKMRREPKQERAGLKKVFCTFEREAIVLKRSITYIKVNKREMFFLPAELAKEEGNEAL